MFGRVWNLAIKELIQLLRQRTTMFFLIALPVAQLILLAQATGQGINNLSLAVLDLDRTAQSRSLTAALDNVPELAWRFQSKDLAELTALIEEGRAAVALVIPSGFGAALAGGTAMPPLQVIVDGSNSVAGAWAQSSVENTIGAFYAREAAQRGLSSTMPVSLRSEVRYNPSLSSRPYTIPAQMGFIVYQVTLAVASLAFARERELGTLEQLLVTPLRRLELITGKAVLAWAMGAVNFFLMYWVVVRGFGVPMRGSFGLLLAFSLLFVAVEIAYGVIISSFARTQQQAILYVFLLAMLDVALSGYLVPVKDMPALFGALAQASPLQHYLVVVRAIMLKGAGLAILWPRAGALAVIGIATGGVAILTAARSLE